MTPDVGSVAEARPNILATSVPPVVAVVNQKGGVGKTTTAINLAAAMAEVGHPTLLVDLDPQANSTSGLGLDPARARLNVYHLLTGEATLGQLVRSRLNPKLAIAGIVMTQFDARTTLAWDVLATVRRTHPHHVLETLIPRNVRISEAPSHGKSVIEYDPTCRGAAAYRALAKELLER